MKLLPSVSLRQEILEDQTSMATITIQEAG